MPHGIERLDRLRFVEMENEVELRRQHCLEVVALEFRIGPIQHADGAFEQGAEQLFRNVGAIQRQAEAVQARTVEQAFVAVFTGQHDLPSFRGTVHS